MRTLSLGLFVTKRLCWQPDTILSAAWEGDLALVEEHIARDPMSVNYVSEHGRTPLTYAVFQFNFSVIRCLVRHGANLDLEDDFSQSPRIHAAVMRICSDVCSRELLEVFESVIDTRKHIDDMPLLSKAICGVIDADFGTLLARLQSRPNGKGIVEEVNELHALSGTPLHCAVRRGDVDAVKALIAAGADPNILNQRLMPPIGYVMCHGSKNRGQAIFKTLVDGGARLDFVQDRGWTFIHLAALSSIGEWFIRRAVANGLDPDAFTGPTASFRPHRVTAARLATLFDRVQNLRCLREVGANMELAAVNHKGDVVMTPLQLALKCGAHACLRFLLFEAGADHLNFPGGRTIMHYVADRADARAIGIVAEAVPRLFGLDLRQQAKDDGLTPLEIFEARPNKTPELIKAWEHLVQLAEEKTREWMIGGPQTSAEVRLGGHEVGFQDARQDSEMEEKYIGFIGWDEDEDDVFYDAVEAKASS